MKIVLTADGSHTIFVPEMNEHYHSVYGAFGESQFIFIRAGFDFCTADQVRIFEAGFGTGLNAFLTAIACLTSGRSANYTAVEKYPVPADIIRELNYKEFAGNEYSRMFDLIHQAEWNVPVTIHDRFILTKRKLDLVSDTPEGEFDLIYFDAFGPDKQPEMWTDEVFRKISAITAGKGVLVTYSAKGMVRRTLKMNGFAVSLLPGPPGKRQITRAVKI
ncbi:MAG: tRNA (5-methylaminomethyl-2-thiouridine)(34)-methyltransferase MnmD [Bacteroidales bacterium]